jgi:uncharacterized protein (DUF3084 family)
MTLAILLFGLVIATCLIAYIADNIGKNMGKKRVSLFGLRPRQTATLISMASSVFIMLATVGILMATSQSLSNALLRYDAEKRIANREREKLQNQNRELQSNLESQLGLIRNQKKQIEQNSKLVADFSKQRKDAESQLKTANAKLKAARAGETKARAQTQRAQTQLASARRQFQTFQAQLKAAKAQVAQAKSRVASAQSQVQSAQAKLKSEQSELAMRRRELARAKSDLRKAEGEQKKASENLRLANEKISLAQTAVNKSLAEREKFATEIAELQVRRDNLMQQVTAQQEQLAVLKEQNLKIGEYALQIATGNISIPVGDVFAERTVRANLSAGQVREELRALMREGREHLPNLPQPQTLALVKHAAAANLSDDEFLDGFAAYLSTLRVPVSIRLLSARNHAPGETEINVQLVPIIIRPIFAQGEVLGEAVIQSGSDVSVFNQLLKLLNTTEQRARERGVAPLPTRENPLFYPTGTNERVFEALRQIQSQGGNVEVRLVATEDISSIDSPNVRFEIAPSTSP